MEVIHTSEDTGQIAKTAVFPVFTTAIPMPPGLFGGPDVGDAGRKGDVTRRHAGGIRWVFEIAMRAAYPNQLKILMSPLQWTGTRDQWTRLL